ncbi:MAG TPA: hypothetical protein VHQ01_12190, partial [Pyrinomonadaceae bacterium]|nr:hypothetical protein [Pyrinomonadaceae bacterium]
TVELSYSEPKIKILSAGESVTLTPPDNLVNTWTNFAARQGIIDIDKVRLDIRQVGFTDGSSWFRGIWSHKDPETGRAVFGKPESP